MQDLHAANCLKLALLLVRSSAPAKVTEELEGSKLTGKEVCEEARAPLLAFAIVSGSEALVKVLVERGADVNSVIAFSNDLTSTSPQAVMPLLFLPLCFGLAHFLFFFSFGFSRFGSSPPFHNVFA